MNSRPVFQNQPYRIFGACPCGPGAIRLSPISFEQQAHRAAPRPGHPVTPLSVIGTSPSSLIRELQLSTPCGLSVRAAKNR